LKPLLRLHLLTSQPPHLKSQQLLERHYWQEKDSSKLEHLKAKLQEALDICDRLSQTPDELTNLLRGLNGEYIPPAPGGDLLRDGPGVLPTGRNIHALDPYRMPSPAAYERGRAIGRQLIAQHVDEHGSFPETIAVMLWGLDAIKTKGESLGILLELVGAEPVKEGTGRIVRYELLPLETMDHPRIDVLANLSGFFGTALSTYWNCWTTSSNERPMPMNQSSRTTFANMFWRCSPRGWRTPQRGCSRIRLGTMVRW
jgi:magnesium chelatase subunit H